MNAPLYVTPTPLPGGLPPTNAELADLLRQMIDVQREQVTLLRAQLAATDGLARWRAFLNRWSEEFPEIGGECKQAIPTLERAYIVLIRDLLGRMREVEEDLGDDFVLTEFLDRFGTKLTQLGNMISNLSPIADAAPADAPTA
ncbi:MAG TPA: hypothetical protein VN641_04325 [Urbifossiella sp.]|jgi:hypothetical protein|nr:hypothetical protein [Urbifossiella sp.]